MQDIKTMILTLLSAVIRKKVHPVCVMGCTVHPNVIMGSIVDPVCFSSRDPFILPKIAYLHQIIYCEQRPEIANTSAKCCGATGQLESERSCCLSRPCRSFSSRLHARRP